MERNLINETLTVVEDELSTVNTWLQTRLGMDYKEHILYKEFIEEYGFNSNAVSYPVDCVCGNLTDYEDTTEECEVCKNVVNTYNMLNRLEQFKEWLEDNHDFN